MEELIRKLDEAEVGERELDAEISVAIEPGEILWKQTRYTMEEYPAVKRPRSNYVQGYAVEHVPYYTKSVDAALSLVPEGWHVQLFGKDGGGVASVQSHFVDIDEAKAMGKRGEPIRYFPIYGKPFALALCIAALKARVSVSEKKKETQTPVA